MRCPFVAGINKYEQIKFEPSPDLMEIKRNWPQILDAFVSNLREGFDSESFPLFSSSIFENQEKNATNCNTTICTKIF